MAQQMDLIELVPVVSAWEGCVNVNVLDHLVHRLLDLLEQMTVASAANPNSNMAGLMSGPKTVRIQFSELVLLLPSALYYASPVII